MTRRKASPYRSEKTVRAYVAKLGGEFYRAFDRPLPDADYAAYWAFGKKEGFQKTEIQTKNAIYLAWLPEVRPGTWKQPGVPIVVPEYEGAK